MLNFWRTTNVFNGGIGVEYIQYLSEDPRPEDQLSKLTILGAGGQVVVPAFLKDYYHFGEPFRKASFAVVPLIGWRMRYVDFVIYYKHYTSMPFNHSIDGNKDLGKDKARIGYHLICIF